MKYSSNLFKITLLLLLLPSLNSQATPQADGLFQQLIAIQSGSFTEKPGHSTHLCGLMPRSPGTSTTPERLAEQIISPQRIAKLEQARLAGLYLLNYVSNHLPLSQNHHDEVTQWRNIKLPRLFQALSLLTRNSQVSQHKYAVEQQQEKLKIEERIKKFLKEQHGLGRILALLKPDIKPCTSEPTFGCVLTGLQNFYTKPNSQTLTNWYASWQEWQGTQFWQLLANYQKSPRVAQEQLNQTHASELQKIAKTCALTNWGGNICKMHPNWFRYLHDIAKQMDLSSHPKAFLRIEMLKEQINQRLHRYRLLVNRFQKTPIAEHAKEINAIDLTDKALLQQSQQQITAWLQPYAKVLQAPDAVSRLIDPIACRLMLAPKVAKQRQNSQQLVNGLFQALTSHLPGKNDAIYPLVSESFNHLVQQCGLSTNFAAIFPKKDTSYDDANKLSVIRSQRHKIQQALSSCRLTTVQNAIAQLTSKIAQHSSLIQGLSQQQLTVPLGQLAASNKYLIKGLLQAQIAIQSKQGQLIATIDKPELLLEWNTGKDKQVTTQLHTGLHFNFQHQQPLTPEKMQGGIQSIQQALEATLKGAVANQLTTFMGEISQSKWLRRIGISHQLSSLLTAWHSKIQLDIKAKTLKITGHCPITQSIDTVLPQLIKPSGSFAKVVVQGVEQCLQQANNWKVIESDVSQKLTAVGLQLQANAIRKLPSLKLLQCDSSANSDKQHCYYQARYPLAEILPSTLTAQVGNAPFIASYLNIRFDYQINATGTSINVTPKLSLDRLRLDRWRYSKLNDWLEVRPGTTLTKPTNLHLKTVPLALVAGAEYLLPGRILLKITGIQTQGQSPTAHVQVQGNLEFSDKTMAITLNIRPNGIQWHYDHQQLAQWLKGMLRQAIPQAQFLDSLMFATQDIAVNFAKGIHLSPPGKQKLVTALTTWANNASIPWHPVDKVAGIVNALPSFGNQWQMALQRLQDPKVALNTFFQTLDLGNLVSPDKYWRQGRLVQQWPQNPNSTDNLFHLNNKISAKVRCINPNNTALIPYYRACEVTLILADQCQPRINVIGNDSNNKLDIYYVPFLPLEIAQSISTSRGLSSAISAHNADITQSLTGCIGSTGTRLTDLLSSITFPPLQKLYRADQQAISFGVKILNELQVPVQIGLHGIEIGKSDWSSLNVLQRIRLLADNQFQLPLSYSIAGLQFNTTLSKPKPGNLKLACTRDRDQILCSLDVKIGRCSMNWRNQAGRPINPTISSRNCKSIFKNLLTKQLGLQDIDDLAMGVDSITVTPEFRLASSWDGVVIDFNIENNNVEEFRIPIILGFDGTLKVAQNVNVGYLRQLLSAKTARWIARNDIATTVIDRCQTFEKQAKTLLRDTLNTILGYSAEITPSFDPGCPKSLFDTHAYKLENQAAIFKLEIKRTDWQLCIDNVRYRFKDKRLNFSQAKLCSPASLKSLNASLRKALSGFTGKVLQNLQINEPTFTQDKLLISYQVTLNLEEIGTLLKIPPQPISGLLQLPLTGGVLKTDIDLENIKQQLVNTLLRNVADELRAAGDQSINLFEMRFELLLSKLRYDNKTQNIHIAMRAFDDNRLGLNTTRTEPLFNLPVTISKNGHIDWDKKAFKDKLITTFQTATGLGDILRGLVSIPAAGISVDEVVPLIPSESKPFSFNGIRFLAQFEAPSALKELLSKVDIFPIKVWFRLDEQGLHAENFDGISIPLDIACIPIPPLAVEPSSLFISENAISIKGTLAPFECELKRLVRMDATVKIPFDAVKINTMGNLVLINFLPLGNATVVTDFKKQKVTYNLAIGGILKDIIALNGYGITDAKPPTLLGTMDAKLFGYSVTDAKVRVDLKKIYAHLVLKLLIANFHGKFSMGGGQTADLRATAGVNLIIAHPKVHLGVNSSYVDVGLSVWGMGVNFTIANLHHLNKDQLRKLFKINFGLLNPKNLLRALESLLSGKISINGFDGFSAKSGNVHGTDGSSPKQGKGGKKGQQGSEKSFGDYQDLQQYVTSKAPKPDPLPEPDVVTKTKTGNIATLNPADDESPYRLRLVTEGNKVRVCRTKDNAPCTDANTTSFANVKVQNAGHTWQHFNVSGGLANSKGYIEVYSENLFSHIISHKKPSAPCGEIVALHWFAASAPVGAKQPVMEADTFVTGYFDLNHWNYPTTLSSQQGLCFGKLPSHLGQRGKTWRLRRIALNHFIFDTGKRLTSAVQNDSNAHKREQFFAIGNIVDSVLEINNTVNSKEIVSLIVSWTDSPYLKATADHLSFYVSGWQDTPLLLQLLDGKKLATDRGLLRLINTQLLRSYNKWWQQIEKPWQQAIQAKKDTNPKGCVVDTGRPPFVSRVIQGSQNQLMLETPIGLYVLQAGILGTQREFFGAGFELVESFQPQTPEVGCIQQTPPRFKRFYPPVIPIIPDEEDPTIPCWNEVCEKQTGCKVHHDKDYLKQNSQVRLWHYIDEDTNKQGCQHPNNRMRSSSSPFVTIDSELTTLPDILSWNGNLSLPGEKIEPTGQEPYFALLKKLDPKYCTVELQWYRPVGATAGPSNKPLKLRVENFCTESCKADPELTGFKCVNRKLSRLLELFAKEVGIQFSKDPTIKVELLHLDANILIYRINDQIRALSRNSPVKHIKLKGILAPKDHLCFIRQALNTLGSSILKTVVLLPNKGKFKIPNSPDVLGMVLEKDAIYVAVKGNCSGKLRHLANLELKGRQFTKLDPMSQNALLDTLASLYKNYDPKAKVPRLGLVEKPGNFGAVFAPSKTTQTLFVRGPNRDAEAGILRAIRKHLRFGASPSATCTQAQQAVAQHLNNLSQDEFTAVHRWMPLMRKLTRLHIQGKAKELQEFPKLVMHTANIPITSEKCRTADTYCNFMRLSYCLMEGARSNVAQTFFTRNTPNPIDHIIDGVIDETARLYYQWIRKQVMHDLRQQGAPSQKTVSLFYERAATSEQKDQGHQRLAELILANADTQKTQQHKTIPSHWYLTRSGLYGVVPPQTAGANYSIQRLQSDSQLKPYQVKIILAQNMQELPWGSAALPPLLGLLDSAAQTYQLHILSATRMALVYNNKIFFSLQSDNQAAQVIEWLNPPSNNILALQQLANISDMSIGNLQQAIKESAQTQLQGYFALKGTQKLFWFKDQLICLEGCNAKLILPISQQLMLNRAFIEKLATQFPFPQTILHRTYGKINQRQSAYLIPNPSQNSWRLFWPSEIKGQVTQRTINIPVSTSILASLFALNTKQDRTNDPDKQERQRILTFIRKQVTDSQQNALLLGKVKNGHYSWLLRLSNQPNTYQLIVLASNYNAGKIAGTLAVQNWDQALIRLLLDRITQLYGQNKQQTSICGQKFADGLPIKGRQAYLFFASVNLLSKQHPLTAACMLNSQSDKGLVLFFEKRLRDKPKFLASVLNAYQAMNTQATAMRIDQPKNGGKVFILDATTQKLNTIQPIRSQDQKAILLDIGFHYANGGWQYSTGQENWICNSMFNKIYRHVLQLDTLADIQQFVIRNKFAYTKNRRNDIITIYLDQSKQHTSQGTKEEQRLLQQACTLDESPVAKVYSSFLPQELNAASIAALSKWCNATESRCNTILPLLERDASAGDTNEYFLIASQEYCQPTKIKSANTAIYYYEGQETEFSCIATAEQWGNWGSSSLPQSLWPDLIDHFRQNSAPLDLYPFKQDAKIFGYLLAQNGTPKIIKTYYADRLQYATIHSNKCKNQCNIEDSAWRHSLLKPFKQASWEQIHLQDTDRNAYGLYAPGPDFILRNINAGHDITFASPHTFNEISASSLYQPLLNQLDIYNARISKIGLDLDSTSTWESAHLLTKNATWLIMIKDTPQKPPLLVEWQGFNANDEWHQPSSSQIWQLIRNASNNNLTQLRLETCPGRRGLRKNQDYGVIRVVGLDAANQPQKITFLVNDANSDDANSSGHWEHQIELYDPQQSTQQAQWFRKRFPTGSIMKQQQHMTIIPSMQTSSKPWCNSSIFAQLIPHVKGNIGEKIFGLTEHGYVLKNAQDQFIWHFTRPAFQTTDTTKLNYACINAKLVNSLTKLMQAGFPHLCKQACSSSCTNNAAQCHRCWHCFVDHAVVQDPNKLHTLQANFPSPNTCQ